MKLTKAKSFFIGIGALMTIYFVTLFVSQNVLATIGQSIIMAIPALVIAYSGANVADNYQKAKYYNPSLDGK